VEKKNVENMPFIFFFLSLSMNWVSFFLVLTKIKSSSSGCGCMHLNGAKEGIWRCESAERRCMYDIEKVSVEWWVGVIDKVYRRRKIYFYYLGCTFSGRDRGKCRPRLKECVAWCCCKNKKKLANKRVCHSIACRMLYQSRFSFTISKGCWAKTMALERKKEMHVVVGMTRTWLRRLVREGESN